MKDIFVLLVLLSAHTIKVCSQGYAVNSDGNCHEQSREYKPDESNLCCKKCPPGQHWIQDCTETTETVCKQCESGLFTENWNYAKNCRSCNRCKEHKGLMYAQNCTLTTQARCKCMPGMYCTLGYEDSYCTECRRYTRCKVGFGVSVPGTERSDVKCALCSDGTFSDTISYTDPCRPHRDCHGRTVVRKGNTTSDNVCEPVEVTPAEPQIKTREPHVDTVHTTVTTMRAISDSTLSVMPSVTNISSIYTRSDIRLIAVIAGVITVTLLVIIIIVILVFICKPVWKKDPEEFHPKVDANGNCESGDKISQGCLGETQLTSFTVTSPEQQCLLEKGEACSDHSQSSNNTETLTRTDGSSSQDSIGPLQSTVAINNLCSALSEPMTLISNPEPITPQPSIPSQSSSQPTSPHIISPVTTSPHVNVNITFHIGNGSCGTPSVVPTNLKEADCTLPFGEEEESFSIPQQEDGKQSLMSVQDSESYSI
ncbi:tumor necrosis factor receptor superfamily member 1B-like [Lates japonicus]